MALDAPLFNAYTRVGHCGRNSASRDPFGLGFLTRPQFTADEERQRTPCAMAAMPPESDISARDRMPIPFSKKGYKCEKF
jgi:hypothetical protein